jgi:hypothetical protein
VTRTPGACDEALDPAQKKSPPYRAGSFLVAAA